RCFKSRGIDLEESSPSIPRAIPDLRFLRNFEWGWKPCTKCGFRVFGNRKRNLVRYREKCPVRLISPKNTNFEFSYWSSSHFSSSQNEHAATDLPLPSASVRKASAP